MIYPSGLIMGKVYHGLKKTDRSDQVSYTKHYYAGSERISAKTGTLTFLGEFPNAVLASEMPNLNVSALRGVSTASVTDAGAIVTGVYNKFGMTPPPLAPMVEENQTTTYHDPARLTISYFHPDHLGSSSYITNAAGIVTQHLEYMAFGEVFVEEHSNSLNSPFKFNGKELDGETGNYYYGARYYDPKLSTFISVDPLAEMQPGKTPYHYCSNNPINRTDPTGMIDGEFERDKNGKWQKISTKGDEIGVDFYHTDKKDKDGNQLTYVTDRKENWNVIKNGRETLSGKQRDSNVDWGDVYNEWKRGTGPEKSFFEGSHSSIKDLRFSPRLWSNFENFVGSGKSKGKYPINFNLLDLWISSNNMQLQMMGSFNASFYSLGDNVFTIIQDSKSRQSFYYRATENNYTRNELIYNPKSKDWYIDNRESNTYQTYIYMQPKKWNAKQ